MAIDYGNYAQIYGGGFDLSPIEKGVSNFMQQNKEARALAVGRMNDEVWADLMKPYQNAVSKDVSQWDFNSFTGLDAGSALLKFKQIAKSKGDRFYNEAASQGLFNPITFKQQYDQMKAAYTPNIESKLEAYQETHGLTDKDMQGFLGQRTDLRNFLLDNANPAGKVRDLARPYTPSGFFPGAIEEVASQPFRYGTSLGAGRALTGAWKEAKDWKDFAGMTKGAKAGLASNYAFMNPLKGEFGKGGVPSLQSIAEDLKKTGFGSKYDKGAKTSAKRWKAKLGGATRSRNAAFKNATGKKWDPNAKGDAKKLQTKWSKAANWKGKEGAGGAAKTAKFNKLAGKSNRAQGRLGQGAYRGIQNILKKHGKAKVISTLAKQLGWKQAAKVAGKLIVGTGLTATGVGSVAGLAMNAWTLYDIYSILSKALGETGGMRSLDKMAFGGGTRNKDALNLQ
tara:strand:+ start:893 stop:2248 length:1356 start_codon:yes stop_codon:yes gene_type:complete